MKDQSTETSKPGTPATGVVDQPASHRLPVSSSSHASISGPSPVKRSRLAAPSSISTAAHQTASITTSASSLAKPSVSESIPEVDRTQSSAAGVPLSHSSIYDPLDMEDEQEEEMISLDQVKPEPISVYTINDDNDDEDSLDHHGGSNLSGNLGNESSGMSYSYLIGFVLKWIFLKRLMFIFHRNHLS